MSLVIIEQVFASPLTADEILLTDEADTQLHGD